MYRVLLQYIFSRVNRFQCFVHPIDNDAIMEGFTDVILIIVTHSVCRTAQGETGKLL